MEEKRPRIRPELTALDKTLETIGWLTVLTQWLLLIFNYQTLPDTVPVHFNASGQADDWGNKATIFFLPVLGAVLFSGMTILNKHPYIFNFPVAITEQNAERQYSIATRLIRYLKFVIVLTFLIIEFQIFQTAWGNSEGLGIGFLPFMLILIFVPIIFFIFKSIKIR